MVGTTAVVVSSSHSSLDQSGGMSYPNRRSTSYAYCWQFAPPTTPSTPGAPGRRSALYGVSRNAGGSPAKKSSASVPSVTDKRQRDGPATARTSRWTAQSDEATLSLLLGERVEV